jgi:hypothetical protein
LCGGQQGSRPEAGAVRAGLHNPSCVHVAVGSLGPLADSAGPGTTRWLASGMQDLPLLALGGMGGGALRASSVQSRHQLPATGLTGPGLSTGRTYRVVHPVGSRERVHMISCGLRDLRIWLYLASLAGSGPLAGGFLLTAKEENLQRAGDLLARPAQ